MKTILIAFCIIVTLALTLGAQTPPERRVIEVSGSAERWITPDEFTFKITLNERMEKKDNHRAAGSRVACGSIGARRRRC